MCEYRVKLIQAGTERVVDGKLSHAEMECRLNLEEALHRASGWVVEHLPGELVLQKRGIERRIKVEVA